MNNISMTRGTKCEKFQQLEKKKRSKIDKNIAKISFWGHPFFFERQLQNWWNTPYFGPTDMKIEYLRQYFVPPTTRTPLS